MKLGGPVDFRNGAMDLFGRPRRQEIIVLAEQPVGDFSDLFDRLAGAEDDFGEALTEGPVAV